MRRSAFTLMELLIVVAIIAVMIGMLMPVVGVVRESGNAAKCRSNLRNITSGIESYVQDWSGYLPPSMIMQAVVPADYQNYGTYYSGPLGSAAYWTDEPLVGGYIDGPEFWNNAVLGDRTNLAAARGSFLRCPSDRTGWITQAGNMLPSSSYGLTCKLCKYVVALTPRWSNDWQAWTTLLRRVKLRKPADLVVGTETKDGRYFPDYNPSPAVAYRTDPTLPISWAASTNQTPNAWFMRHRGGCNLLFADGHVRYTPDLEIEVRNRTVFTCMEDMP